MAGNSLHTVLDHLRRLHRVADASQRSDGELLHAFVAHNDQDAFAVVVARHAPLVWGVCRRILGHQQDAEDAFQATFLVLARRAGSIRTQTSIGGWLHTVAQRLAVRLRKQVEQRRIHESEASRLPPQDASLRELAAVVDEELQRLPTKYREPLLLHYLEGATAEAAVRQLGLGRTAFYNRLAYGRELLRERLSRQGLSLAAPLLVAALTAEAETASLSLIQATIRGALGSVPEHVATLAAEAMGTAGLVKLKIGLAIGLLLGIGAVGVAMLTPSAVPAPLPPAEYPVEPPKAEDKSAMRVDRYGDPLPAGAVARLGTIHLHHSGWVSGVAYSPDGKLLASGGWDERVRLWDAKTGKELRQYNLGRRGQGAKPINGVAFSPDGKLLAAVGWGTEPGLWDVASGKVIRGSLDTARYVVFSPDSRTVITGGLPDGGAALLDLKSNKRRGIPVGAETIHAAVFSPDGKLLAATGPKNRISLWDAASLKELRSLRGHKGEVRSVDFAPDSKQLVSGGMDKTVRLWDVGSGKEIRCFQTAGLVDGVRYSPDGKTIAARSDGRVILLWDVQSGEKLRQFAGYGGGFTFPMAFSPDGSKLLAVQGNALQVWETATGEELFPASAIRVSFDNFAYSGDGRSLATVSWEGTIRLWDTATYRELRRFGGRQTGIRSLAFSADGRFAATAAQDKTTRLWDAATGKELFRWDTDINDGFNLTFTPDGRVLASCNGDASVQLWLTSTGKPLRRLKGHVKGPVYSIAFSPDGKTLASGALDKTVRLWDWKAGRELRVLAGHPGWVMASEFAPDGRSVASAGGSANLFVRLWDVDTGKELRRFEAHEPGLNTAIGSLAFSPDGRMLASAGFGETIHLWELATGKERCRFRGHEYRIEKVAFSPDGHFLASAGGDGAVLFWDATGRLLDGRPLRQRLTRQEWETCWRDLADADARKAYRALQALVADPEQSVVRLKVRVPAVPAADAQRTARLIRELDSDDFAVRTKAEQELAKQGESVRAALEQTLQEKPSLEARRRIEQLLEQLEPEHSPPQLRLLRTVEAVELMQTPKARQLLEKWSRGVPAARLTHEAKASLHRLDLRKSSPSRVGKSSQSRDR